MNKRAGADDVLITAIALIGFGILGHLHIMLPVAAVVAILVFYRDRF